MKKVYRVSVVGVPSDTKCAVVLRENTIAKNEKTAFEQVSGKFGFDKIWTKHVSVNWKETMKMLLLDMIGLKSVTLSFERKKE